MPRLQVLNGKRQGATFEVGRGGVVVGHRNTAPVSIDDPWVSWDHAKIFQQNEGFWIEDLGSTNGTFVNCVRVKRERLNHEDIIFFGKTHVIFLVAEMATNDGESSPSEEKKRSSFEVNVAAVAAAANWPAPTTPGGRNGGGNGRSAGDRTTLANNAPLRADELPLGPSFSQGLGAGAQGLASPGFEPGEESSRSRRDPFRPGADPWDKRIAPGKGSSALVNLDPEADPFSSARAENAKGADPFTVGADPFDGPRQRSVADTQHDIEDGSQPKGTRPTSEDGTYPSTRSPTGVGIEIDEFEPDNVPVAPVSAAEVSSLIKKERSSDGEEANLDDLDALLGDNAARTPDPGLYKASSGTGKVKKPSEALTRPIDTEAAREAVAEKPRNNPSKTTLDLNGPLVPPPPPPPAPAAKASPPVTAPPLPPVAPGAPSGTGQRSGTGRIAPLPPDMASNARTQPLVSQNPPAPPPAPRPDESRPLAAADLAFEVAKLQDEVRRLRMALDSARQADPEKVRVAVEGLRAEELGRQAREIAELRGELANLKEAHAKSLAELDDVTADMINKEDEIDALKRKLGGGSKSRGEGTSADELRALEF